MPGPEINEIGIHRKDQTLTIFTGAGESRISFTVSLDDHYRLRVSTKKNGSGELPHRMIACADGRFHDEDRIDEIRNFGRVLVSVPGAKPLVTNRERIRKWQLKQKPPNPNGDIKRGGRKSKRRKKRH